MVLLGKSDDSNYQLDANLNSFTKCFEIPLLISRLREFGIGEFTNDRGPTFKNA
jgi:hypothetical protein